MTGSGSSWLSVIIRRIDELKPDPHQSRPSSDKHAIIISG